MLRRIIAVASIALLTLAALAACGEGNPTPPGHPVTRIPCANCPTPLPTFNPNPEAANAPAAATSGAAAPAASGGQASSGPVTIDMEDIKFVPKDFTIPANTDVKVTIDNKGALPHDFSITDHKNPNVKNLNISVTLDPGKSQTITINAPPGSYYFYCNQPGHEAAGMYGTMTVVASSAAGAASGGSASPAAAGASPSAATPASAAASPAASPSAASPSAASPAAAVAAKPVTVDMEDIKFVPNKFTIPANTDLKLTLVNKGALPHDFSVNAHKNPNLKDLNIRVTLPPGQSQTITVNAPPGDYYFYCNEPGHEAAGMYGTMTVK